MSVLIAVERQIKYSLKEWSMSMKLYVGNQGKQRLFRFFYTLDFLYLHCRILMFFDILPSLKGVANRSDYTHFASTPTFMRDFAKNLICQPMKSPYCDRT